MYNKTIAKRSILFNVNWVNSALTCNGCIIYMFEKERGKLYLTIKNHLLELIEKNYLDLNYKLPSENQLVLKFHASRISARHALEELVKEGVIFKIQGKGSYISKNYTPSKKAAASTSNSDTPIIALLIPGVGSRFFTHIIEGAKNSLSQLGFQLIVLFTDGNTDKEKTSIRFALEKGCRGIIILPVDNQIYNPEILKLAINHYPIILLDRKFEGLDISYVACDHLNATYTATKLLLNLSHSQIAFISPIPKIASSIVERIKGYEQAISEFSSSKSLICYLSDKFEPRYEEMRKFISENRSITAVICEGGKTALELINLINSKTFGMRTIECVFFDNEFSDFTHFLPLKPIIIDQNPYNIGFQSGQLMKQLLTSPLEKTQIILSNATIQ